MRPYSQDLRERIIAALEANEQTQAEIAERLGVSVSTVEKLWKRCRMLADVGVFYRTRRSAFGLK